MIKIPNQLKKDLIKLKKDKNVFLEGNFVKLIDDEGDDEFKQYLNFCIEKDKEIRKKRLDITKQIQNQNKELIEWKEVNENLTQDLKVQMAKVEMAKDEAENNLDVLQKKTQFELINMIVRIALFIIIGVGVLTTGLYIISMFTNKDTQIIGSTWSNMFGILLTNAFSIVGTIMGVKYATEKK